MNRKPRPPDGPGANGLRGGKNIYSSRVCIGGYVEDVGGPAMYNPGFTTEDFESENQRYGGQKAVLRYGAALPVRVNAEQPTTFDVFAPAKELNSSTWRSTIRETYQPLDLTVTSENPWTKRSPVSPEVEEYRKTWTQDSETARRFRFQVESRLPNNKAVAKFKVSDVRMLPGTPMSVEKLRRKLIERYGIFAFSALRATMKSSHVSFNEFHACMKQLDIDMPRSELDQVFSYFTPYDSFDASHFVRTLLTNMSDYRDTIAQRLCKAAQPHFPISVEKFISKFVMDDASPEIKQGMTKFFPVYANEGSLDKDSIEAICFEMYAASPCDFMESEYTIWQLP